MTRKIKEMRVDDEAFALIRGSGNNFRYFNDPNPDYHQLMCILAVEIVRTLDARKLSVRQAQKVTGFAAADFSRIRSAKLDRFTIDRLMMMLDKLGQDVDIAVTVRPRVGFEYTGAMA